MAAALRQNGGTVTLRLHPEDLGELKVRVQLYNGRVEARFEVVTEKARDLLDRTVSTLRQALQDQGLRVDRLEIHSSPAQDRHAPAGQDDSGPAFANDQQNYAGGEAGGHGRPGAESADGGAAQDRAPGAAAEQNQEPPPDAARSGPLGGTPGGAPDIRAGLDAVA